MATLNWRTEYQWFRPFFAYRKDALARQFDKYPITHELKDGAIWVHFVDVSIWSNNIVITTKDKTVVIDLSYAAGGLAALEYLKAIGISTIDLLVLTHPHQDHLNKSSGYSYHTPHTGLRDFLDAFDIKEIWYNGDKISNTNTAGQEVLTSVLGQIFPDGYTEHDDPPTYRGTPITMYVEPKCIEAPYVRNVGGIELRVIHPGVMGSSVNNNSIVIKLVWGNTSFMLSADAQIGAENEILGKVQSEILDLESDVASDVLFIGHHGMESTSEQWLDAVNPKYAVAQTSTEGYPQPQILRLLDDRGIPLYHPFRDASTYVFESNGIVVKPLEHTMYKWI